jgi:hypothetical protein
MHGRSAAISAARQLLDSTARWVDQMLIVLPSTEIVAWTAFRVLLS